VKLRTSANRRLALAGTFAAGLFLPMAATAEDIRVVFLPSPDLLAEVQSQALAKAIERTRDTSLRVVQELGEAHVLVQFNGYHVDFGGKDGPARRWDGQSKLLVAPEGGRARLPVRRVTERFGLLVGGEDGREMERTVELLERYLREALGLPKEAKRAQREQL
jgi:hypothetical protein